MDAVNSFLADHRTGRFTVPQECASRTPVALRTEIVFRRATGHSYQDRAESHPVDHPAIRWAGSRGLTTDETPLVRTVLCVNKPHGLRSALSVPPSVARSSGIPIPAAVVAHCRADS